MIRGCMDWEWGRAPLFLNLDSRFLFFPQACEISLILLCYICSPTGVHNVYCQYLAEHENQNEIVHCYLIRGVVKNRTDSYSDMKRNCSCMAFSYLHNTIVASVGLIYSIYFLSCESPYFQYIPLINIAGKDCTSCYNQHESEYIDCS